MIRPFLVLLLIAGCASKPTPYQKEKKQEGFTDGGFEGLSVARFRGNSYTKKDKAQTFAEFRAIQVCSETENKHANIIDVFDKTIQKNIIRSSGSGWGPSYGMGMYPYYSRYSSFGFGVGFNTVSTNSWNETLIYPVMEVYYTCSDKIIRPEIVFKEISAEDMKHLVKDVKGAIQVESIPEISPNTKAVERGDIILKANGKRIEKVYELIRLFVTQESEISVQILREGERVISKLKGKDVTSEVEKTEKDIVTRVCGEKDKHEKLKKVSLCK